MNSITLSALAGFPERLEAHYATIPAEFKHWAQLSWEGVPSEPFTAIEQICHIRDIEVDGYHVRFRRMLDEVSLLVCWILARWATKGDLMVALRSE